MYFIEGIAKIVLKIAIRTWTKRTDLFSSFIVESCYRETVDSNYKRSAKPTFVCSPPNIQMVRAFCKIELKMSRNQGFNYSSRNLVLWAMRLRIISQWELTLKMCALGVRNWYFLSAQLRTAQGNLATESSGKFAI